MWTSLSPPGDQLVLLNNKEFFTLPRRTSPEIMINVHLTDLNKTDGALGQDGQRCGKPVLIHLRQQLTTSQLICHASCKSIRQALPPRAFPTQLPAHPQSFFLCEAPWTDPLHSSSMSLLSPHVVLRRLLRVCPEGTGTFLHVSLRSQGLPDGLGSPEDPVNHVFSEPFCNFNACCL